MNYDLFDKIIMRNPLNSIDDVNISMKEYNQLFVEGVYTSSPNFEKLIEARIADIPYNDNVLIAYKKFWIRSCTRCSPYGTFAGSSLLNVSSETHISLNAQNNFKKYLRLDMSVLSSLVEAIKNMPQIRNQLIYSSNNSIYTVNKTLRFIHYSYHLFNREYHLSDTRKSSFLESVLLEAKNGKTISYLINFISNQFKINYIDSEQYINDLIESQVLLSNIELKVTGEDPLHSLINSIEKIENIEGLVKQLKDIRNLIDNFNSLNYDKTSLKLIEDKINNIELDFEVPITKFHTDLFITTDKNNIDKNVLRLINQQTERLEALSKDAESKDFKNFKNRFFKLYGNDYEIPLNIVLDPDYGIGYGHLVEKNFGNLDLIQKIYDKTDDNKADIRISYLDKMISSKLYNFQSSSSNSIEITDDDIDSLQKNNSSIKKTYPVGKFILGSLLKKNGVVEANNFHFYLKEISINSASTLLGRFTIGNEEIMKFLTEVVKKEDEFASDLIHAEIIHLPNNRIGNIIYRPILRKYEIPYVTKTGISKEFEITLEDLLVSFQNGEIVLRSKKFNKRVIPCLSNAHNFYKGEDLPLYKFLCDIQLQGKRTFEWNWGLLANENFLPRVIYKNIIVKAARWKVVKKETEEFIVDDKINDTLWKLWIDKRKIPLNINIIDSNTFIYIDLTKKEFIDLFIKVLNKEEYLFIEESYCTNEHAFIKNIDNKFYVNELIIPLILNKNFIHDSKNFSLFPDDSTKRKFLPNESWIYFKVFAGNKVIEEILVFKILPYIQDNINKTFEKFFFVRYFDDEPTLRLRFFNSNVSNNNLIRENILSILKDYVENLSVKNVQLDTYNREIERYGSSVIEDAESIFFTDSLSALKLLRILQFNEDKYRWIIAMRSVDKFIDSFLSNFKDKLNLVYRIKKIFELEHVSNKNTIININSQYRIYEKFIVDHMNISLDHINGLSEVSMILAERHLLNHKFVSSVRESCESSDLDSLIISFIHMSLNRLFLSEPRKCEFIIYVFLYKYYKTLFSKLQVS